MSAFLYNHIRADAGNAAFSWTACVPKAMLVDAGYTPNLNDQYVSSIPAGAIAVRDLAMSSLANVNGYMSGTVAQANALLWPNPIVAIVIYASTGVDATSRLIYYSSTGFGFPLTAVGFNYSIAMDQAFGAWFAL